MVGPWRNFAVSRHKYEINLFSTYYFFFNYSGTYDQRKLRIRHPVRSALYKQFTGGLVVRWVTTSESPLSYVFAFYFVSFCLRHVLGLGISIKW